MGKEALNQTQLFLFFLSDGAPSDHLELYCPHHVQVWSETHDSRMCNGKPVLQACQSASVCRRDIQVKVRKECVQKFQMIGDLFGHDRVFLATVGFGPANEEYQVLEEMAKTLPRSSFQKLGLTAGGLKTVFSSFSSTLTSMRTETIGEGTRRVFKKHDSEVELHKLERDVYDGAKFVSKERFNVTTSEWEAMPLCSGATGMAHAREYFDAGAERVGYFCSEITRDSSFSSSLTVCRIGPDLVAKELWYWENLNKNFHMNFSRTQEEASIVADLFNRSITCPAAWAIYFVACFVYTVLDSWYYRGQAYVLAEERLEGKLRKWNNNAGKVLLSPAKLLTLGAIGKDDEDNGDDDEEDLVSQVPQCFSHFTYMQSNRKQLVCDLQGVWNVSDGFTLTDSIIHYNCTRGRRHVNGSTDKGGNGMRKFFETHRCSKLCQKLGLPRMPLIF